MGDPQHGLFLMEHPNKMDDLDRFGGTPHDLGKLHIQIVS